MGEISLYYWSLVWLVWNQLYGKWNFFYLQNRLIQTSETGSQGYSDTSPFSILWWERSNLEGFLITIGGQVSIKQVFKKLTNCVSEIIPELSISWFPQTDRQDGALIGSIFFSWCLGAGPWRPFRTGVPATTPTRRQCYKTFYVHNLRIFVIS